MTPFLYHGPEARDKAVSHSLKAGRPVSEPVGDQGLKVDDSRVIVNLAGDPGVGDKPPTLVVGPLDKATPEASDALLKTLEDLSEAPLQIILWADHLSGVSATIRSRTWERWCPASRTYLSSLAHLEKPAQNLAEAVVRGDGPSVLGTLAEAGKEWPELLEALCLVLPNHLGGSLEERERVLSVWEKVRDILDGKGSVLVAADALLPEEI